MLNNRVRFGNMKRVNRAVWALSVILMMVLGLVLAGCSGSSDGADGKEESTYSKIVAIAQERAFAGRCERRAQGCRFFLL